MSHEKFPLFFIKEIANLNINQLLGYYVISTAKINIEDPQISRDNNTSSALGKIVNYLLCSPNPEVTIFVHGYATNQKFAKERTDKLYKYALQVCEHKNHVLFGYIWPSENPIQDGEETIRPTGSILQKIRYALQALPTALIGTLISSLILLLITLALILSSAGQGGIGSYALMALIPMIASALLLKVGDAGKLLCGLPFGIVGIALLLTWVSQQVNQQVFLSLGLSLFGFGFTVVLTLVGLRLSTYFRDQYRATNYAVSDLVELIRQLDLAIYETGISSTGEKFYWTLEESSHPQSKKRIKLNFLAHSMGCFVVTNTIRILSDVFDPLATQGNPESKLGKTLRLGRLTLVAADIPTESIMPGRSNVLQSSLRRCEEAYLFSNEGDLALRLASTAANYFSFPSRSRFFGYRLGNLTAKHFKHSYENKNYKLDEKWYGVVNWEDTQSFLNEPYKFLEIRSSNQEHRNLQELNSPPLRFPDEEFSPDSLVNHFTIFDCTDYRDYRLSPLDVPDSTMHLKPIVSLALQKAALNLVDYLCLSIFFLSRRIDTHGGYFQGQFSQKLMYELTFLGFKPLLLSYRNDPKQDFAELISHFDKECQDKKLQVVLSPKQVINLSLPVKMDGILVDELVRIFAHNYFDFNYPITVGDRQEIIQHRVYWKTNYPPGQESPAVLVMHELPGLTENCLRFAEQLANKGFTVYFPLLFGHIGESSKPFQLGMNTVRFTTQLCISREFNLLKMGASSPVVDWLKGLSQHIYNKDAHKNFPGIGAIGMCLTGGFVLSLMIDDSVIAPVASQPTLPLGLTPNHRKALDISSCDLERAKQKAQKTGLLVVRFDEDIISPDARLSTLEQEFDKTLDKVVITAQQRQEDGIKACPPPHAVFTEHFADSNGHPYQCTQAAFNKVVRFLEEQLNCQSSEGGS